MVFDLVERNGLKVLQAGGIVSERMAGDVKAEHGVFAGKTLFLTPRGSFAQFEWHRRGSGGGSEQSVLAGFARAGSALQSGNGVVHGCQHRFARTERIDCA